MAQFEIKNDIAIIPEGTTEIEERTFENSDVRRVVIPDSVKKIGDRAFAQCKAFTNLPISSSSSSLR